MQGLLEYLEQLLERLDLNRFPLLARIIESMDPIAWALVILLVCAGLLGLFFTVSTRRSFQVRDDLETRPETTLEMLKENPTRIAPLAILSRLGAEATLELLEYGDKIQSKEWRYQWGSVRDDLLKLLAQQNAFGPTYSLARYYRSADTQEPDTLRIRRTALIHKLGVARYLEPDNVGNPACLHVRHHPAEVEGDLGFDGVTVWLLPDEPVDRPPGPLIEMEPVQFRTLQEATVNLHIQRTPTVGGGFTLSLRKRRKMWVIVDEQVDWVG